MRYPWTFRREPEEIDMPLREIDTPLLVWPFFRWTLGASCYTRRGTVTSVHVVRRHQNAHCYLHLHHRPSSIRFPSRAPCRWEWIAVHHKVLWRVLTNTPDRLWTARDRRLVKFWSSTCEHWPYKQRSWWALLTKAVQHMLLNTTHISSWFWGTSSSFAFLNKKLHKNTASAITNSCSYWGWFSHISLRSVFGGKIRLTDDMTMVKSSTNLASYSGPASRIQPISARHRKVMLRYCRSSRYWSIKSNAQVHWSEFAITNSHG